MDLLRLIHTGHRVIDFCRAAWIIWPMIAFLTPPVRIFGRCDMELRRIQGF
jgi:hypothetical protein